MRVRSLRHLTAVGALALAAAATTAACGPAEATSQPRPTPTTVQPTTVQPPTVQPTTAQPTTPGPSHSTGGPPACLGAVVHTIDASETGPAWPRLCIAVGGVIRVENLGPEGFMVSPSDKVSCFYEAGIRECRLIATGTVRFTITYDAHATRVLTVVVARASSPPGPSTACQGTGTYTLDASNHGPPWAALCLRMRVALRVENLGPEGFSVRPSNAVSCRYEAAVRDCHFVRTGTVTFTITRIGEPRTLTVVVIA